MAKKGEVLLKKHMKKNQSVNLGKMSFEGELADAIATIKGSTEIVFSEIVEAALREYGVIEIAEEMKNIASASGSSNDTASQK